MRGLEGDAKKAGDGAQKTERGIKDLAISLGLVKIGAAAFKVLTSSMDTAIKRFDTLNQFPKVLQALGVSAEDSERAMAKLSDGIDGLPTTLDDIASTAQRMYTSFNDMDKATDTALALNNALLGSGASADQAKRGTEQYIKALQTGKFDMDTWNTLSETMDVGLVKIAESFGFAGKSAKDDLYKALQDGTITIDQFNDKMIELGTGTGEMAKLAKENSLGIETSLGNLKNAAARGIADIIASFNKLVQEVTGKDIAQNIDSLKVVVNASFKAMGAAIEATTPIVKLFAGTIKALIPIVKFLSPAITGLAAAYTALMIINKINSIIDKNSAILQMAAFSGEKLTIALAAKTKATAADTAVQVANTGAITLGQAAIGVLTGNISLATVATGLLTTATGALKTVLTALSGPIGWVVGGIGLLVAGTVGLVKWLNRTTEAGAELTAGAERLNEANNELISSVDQSSKSYESNITTIQANAEANADLANKISELSEKENKSAADKELLASYIEQLNGQVEGLNLSYSEEADMMNLSSEQIQARLDLMKEQEAGMAAQERLLEISKEQSEVDQQLEESNRLREEAIALHENEDITKRELKETNEELNESEAELEARKESLREEYVATEEQLTTTMQNIADATEDSIGRQTLLFEDLSESQQATVESMKESWESYKESATNMFDVLSDEVEISASEMADNLEKNQQVITDWSENIAILAERGVDEGLLETLREAGPESAGHVNALVNASDEELERLSTAFKEGGDVATEALSKSLGIEESGVLDAVGHLVTDTESSLKEQINSADFEGIGGDVADGMAKGVEVGAKKAIDASGEMADDMTQKTRQTLQTHSPSRVFKEIGTDVTDGLALGINDGTNKVTEALNKLFKAMETDTTRSFDNLVKGTDKSVKNIGKSLDKLNPLTQKAMTNMLNRLRLGSTQQISLMRNTSRQLVTPFNRMPAQFRSVGMNAMNGLNAGLLSGRGRVLATARAIANSVSAAMRSALRIHSPSRVMKDDVGRWIPEGLAEGIEDNSESVFDALDKMTDGMMKMTSPELALGIAGGGALAGTYNRVTNNSPQSSNVDNRKFTFNANANGTENNDREFYERLFREFKWYIEQEGGAFGG